MANILAKTSFSGIVSMYEGETKEVADVNIVKDLIEAGYVEVIDKPADKVEAKAESKKKGAKS